MEWPEIPSHIFLGLLEKEIFGNGYMGRGMERWFLEWYYC